MTNVNVELLVHWDLLEAEARELLRNAEPLGDGYVKVLTHDVEALEYALGIRPLDEVSQGFDDHKHDIDCAVRLGLGDCNCTKQV